MELEILSAEKYSTKLKATIQATGRLGFTESTASFLRLSKTRFAKFAQEKETGGLYLCVCDKKCPDSFEIRTSGKYYYVPTTILFDMIGFDYINKTIMFDLVRFTDYDDIMGGDVYKMNKREIQKK